MEQKIRHEFIKKGGRPVLDHPLYCFLGRNSRFEEHNLNRGYLIRLKDLPKNTVSFTYGDSMFSLNEDYRRIKGEAYLSELCPQVYKFEELPYIFSHPDFQSEMHLQIEAQLWITPSDTIFNCCD